MSGNFVPERDSHDVRESVPQVAELSDSDLDAVTAGKGGGLGGPYSGLGVRPGVGVGAPGFGWRRGAG